jgi:hypothetical protein
MVSGLHTFTHCLTDIFHDDIHATREHSAIWTKFTWSKGKSVKGPSTVISPQLKVIFRGLPLKLVMQKGA